LELPRLHNSRTALKGEGGTAPIVGASFAMTNFLPQTRENKMGTMAYVYDETSIMGFWHPISQPLFFKFFY
jgi:putative alpha-1,2-mannosidase